MADSNGASGGNHDRGVMGGGLTVPASGIKPVPMKMLWRQRLPASTLSVIAGIQGLGKSTLSTTIAAELSRQGHNVVISNTEDDLAAVVRPRLEVAGANLDLVHLVPADRTPMMPREFEQLVELVLDTKTTCLVLDPIAAHFRPTSKVHDRDILAKLILLGRDAKCAIVGVHHTLKKSHDKSALGLIGGPINGLSGAARAVYLYGYDPSDQDRRALACVKTNGFEKPSTLIIEHETKMYDANGKTVEAGLLHIKHSTGDDAETVLRPGMKKRDRDADCFQWLTEYLAGDPEFQREVNDLRQAGHKKGFIWETLRRASGELGIEKVRIDLDGEIMWIWRLPDDHPARKGEVTHAVE